MVNEKYSIAMAETLYYLKGINQNDVNKISNKFMNFLRKNASKDYECKFDYTKPLKELDLKDETRGLISLICLNYWCETEEEKNKFKEHLNNNEKRYQEELMKKYNPDDIFKDKSKPKIVEKEDIQEISTTKFSQNESMIEVKETFFKKIIRKIKIFLKRKE